MSSSSTSVRQSAGTPLSPRAAAGDALAERMDALRAQLDRVRGMDAAVELVVREAEATAVPEAGDDESRRVATMAAARAADEMQREMLVQALERVTPALPHLGLRRAGFTGEDKEHVDILIRPAETLLQRLSRLRRREERPVRRAWGLGNIVDPYAKEATKPSHHTATGHEPGSMIVVDETGVLWRLARSVRPPLGHPLRTMLPDSHDHVGPWLFAYRESGGGVIDESVSALRPWFAVGEAPALDDQVLDKLLSLLQTRSQEAARQREAREAEAVAPESEAERPEGPRTPRPPAAAR